MIDKEEVLKIIDDVTSETIINVGRIFYSLTSRINGLPIYKDEELLKECYEFLNLHDHDEMKDDEEMYQLFLKLKERLEIE